VGRVYSWVVAHEPMHPELGSQVPYVVALIELAENVRLVGNVVGCRCDEVVADLPVEVFFETRADGWRLPNFRVNTGV